VVDLDERAMAGGAGFNVIVHLSSLTLCNGSSAPSATPIPNSALSRVLCSDAEKKRDRPGHVHC
jgi:hypothetical protein